MIEDLLVKRVLGQLGKLV